MLSLQHDGLRIHYISTNFSTRRVSQFKANPKACIYYYELSYQGFMLTGTMRSVPIPIIRSFCGAKAFEVYYPKGVTEMIIVF